MWDTGFIEIDGRQIYFEAKHYEVGSEFGIDGGRVSKLLLRDAVTKKCLAHYERGWDQKPRTRLARAALKEILAKFN